MISTGSLGDRSPDAVSAAETFGYLENPMIRLAYVVRPTIRRDTVRS